MSPYKFSESPNHASGFQIIFTGTNVAVMLPWQYQFTKLGFFSGNDDWNFITK